MKPISFWLHANLIDEAGSLSATCEALQREIERQAAELDRRRVECERSDATIATVLTAVTTPASRLKHRQRQSGTQQFLAPVVTQVPRHFGGERSKRHGPLSRRLWSG